MKIFDDFLFTKLQAQAQLSPRLRQHHNIHVAQEDPCQRLFNAIEPNSYIRPHRHITDPKHELLVAVRGKMALLTFDDRGAVKEIVRFGTSQYPLNTTVGIEVPPDVWHTVIALETGSVLLEVKPGPFDPLQPKDLAPWAPSEGSPAADQLLLQWIETLEK